MSYGKAQARQFFQDLKANLPAGADLLTELMDGIAFLSTKAQPLQQVRQQAANDHLTSPEGMAAVKAREAAIAADQAG